MDSQQTQLMTVRWVFSPQLPVGQFHQPVGTKCSGSSAWVNDRKGAILFHQHLHWNFTTHFKTQLLPQVPNAVSFHAGLKKLYECVSQTYVRKSCRYNVGEIGSDRQTLIEGRVSKLREILVKNPLQQND